MAKTKYSKFIGREVIISPPLEWRNRYNASGIKIEDRMSRPVDPKIVAELEDKFVDFRRAYAEDGMTPAEFNLFGATRRTLRQFSKATDDLVSLVRDILMPNPDL